MSNYAEYDELISKINDGMSASDAQFAKVTDVAMSDCDINELIEGLSNMSVVKNNNGDVIGYDYTHTYQSQPNTDEMIIDSNTNNGQFSGGHSSGGGAGRYSGSYYSSDGEMKSGAVDSQGNIINTLSGYISAEWAAVSALSKLGFNVDGRAADQISQYAEDFKDTFSGVCTKIGEYGKSAVDVIRTLFGVDDQGNTTMYIDEDTLGALAIQARESGLIEIPKTKDGESDLDCGGCQQPIHFSVGAHLQSACKWQGTKGWRWMMNEFIASTSNFAVASLIGGGLGPYNICASSLPGVSVTVRGLNALQNAMPSWEDSRFSTSTVNLSSSFTYNGKTVYYAWINFLVGSYWHVGSDSNVEVINDFSRNVMNPAGPNNVRAAQTAWTIIYGDISGGIPGIDTQSGATQVNDAIVGDDPHTVAQNILNQYPDVMGDPITVTVLDENCQPVTITYYPVPTSYSSSNLDTPSPSTGGTQSNPTFNPNDTPSSDIDMSKYVDEIVKQLSGSGAGPDVAHPTIDPMTGAASVATLPTLIPKIGFGDTPEPVLPVVSDSPMWHVYNPSSSEVRAFGSWLWTTSIIEQIERLFQNPMDGIVGLHAIYASPHTSGSATIVCGNVASNVTASVVSSQYISLNCGSVWLTEYFGNVFDYSPYTSVNIFLPFIGIVKLNPADVMRAKLTVTYNIDVYTGACIAMIDVERDGAGGTLYQFSGSCAVSYPISSVAYNSIFSSMVSMAVGVAATIAAPSPASAAIGVGAILRTPTTAKYDVTHSGGFTANAGAMGPKKPYLIISRPQTDMAVNYEEYDGRGANTTVMLKDIRGYARCKIVHINIPGAYGEELKEIHDLLTSGVILP